MIARVPAISLKEFESGQFDAANFDHEAHLYIAWKMMKSHPALEAIERYTAALKRITGALGVPGKYHQTITWFYLLKVSERITMNATDSWPDFAAENPDLLSRKPPLVQQYYSAETLQSEAARTQFILPETGISRASTGNPA